MNDETKPAIGSDLKIYLKGESPFVTVIRYTDIGLNSAFL